MAIQFANTAQNIIAGQSAGAGLMSAYSNAARNLGQSIQGIGEGLGVIIQRQREKKAAQMLEDATEEKRRYLAGDFKDDEDKAALVARYSIPESEQFTALAARIRPWSSSLYEGLLDRAKQAKAAEAQQSAINAQSDADILKMGGDPKTIRIENQLRLLNEQRNTLVKNGMEGLNLLNLNDNLKQLKAVNKAISQENRKMLETIGISGGDENANPEGEASVVETEEPEFELTSEAEAVAKDRLLRLRQFTSAEDVKAYLDETAKDETLDPAVRWAISSYGIPYYKQLLAQDSGLLQLEQSRQRLEMDKANRLFSPFEGDAARYGAEYSSLVELLNKWGDPPANFAEAKMRLQLLGSALQSVQAVAGTTKEDSSIVDMLRKAIGLADRDQITAEAYNGAVSGIVDAVFGRAKGHNANVSKSLEMADSPYAKAFGERLLIDIGEKPTFGLATKDYFSKDESKDGSPSGGAGGTTPEEIAQAEEVLRKAGVKFGGK